MASPITVVLNTFAHGADRDKTERRIKELFRARGAEVRILRTGRAGRVPSLRNPRGSGTIVAAGGDGTVAAVAAELVGTSRRLGVLPLGTFNHFAKDAGIPLNLEDAVDVVLTGRARLIDVGKVNGRIFLNNSSIGLYPEIVRARERRREKLGLGKLPAFALATLGILRRPPLLDIELRVKGKAIARRTPGVFVGNNVYRMEGLRLGSRQRLDAGRLSIYMVHATGTDLLKVTARALLGRLRYDPAFEAVLVRRASLVAPRRRRLPVATDGEIAWLETPLRYRILPLALRLVVPRSRRKPARPSINSKPSRRDRPGRGK